MGPLGHALFLAAPIASLTLGGAPSGAVDGGPRVEATAAGDGYVIRGFFEAKVTTGAAWDVLSDYEHIGAFVSSIRRSVIKERRADGVLLEQEGSGHALFIDKGMRVLLDVRELPPTRMEFRDVGGKDFAFYAGEWTVAGVGDGARVSYLLRAKPRLGIPTPLALPAFRASVAELLAQVRDEMVRRSRGR